ncbi:Uncharacterised protein [Zhongshania aliphaticivorans]|uniref:Uncharacterized protein n=1 Tax=Zhongshania aliphaticivorans TaxID=1470434 RepID=A0A5S9N8H7_9GAMM|nr:hypothetical protein [Zhongshania aliphaticivorans]CAA0079068.1 Uncharacterised protein [Zhongshania aliphaticivorans]CAA0086304.1 Uncharacterised protein [Zhongshania aliphaticivorans]
MLEAVAGILFVIAMVWVFRQRHWESWAFSGALICLPLIYISFGVFASSEGVVVKEVVYGLPFLAGGSLLLFYGFRFSAYIVAALWLLHGVYDLYHQSLFVNDAVFSWYPVFCAAVDVSVALYLMWYGTAIRSANLKLAAKLSS